MRVSGGMNKIDLCVIKQSGLWVVTKGLCSLFSTK